MKAECSIDYEKRRREQCSCGATFSEPWYHNTVCPYRKRVYRVPHARECAFSSWDHRFEFAVSDCTCGAETIPRHSKGIKMSDTKQWLRLMPKHIDREEAREILEAKDKEINGLMTLLAKDRKRVEELEIALRWEAAVAGDECAYQTSVFCFDGEPESPDLWCTYCRITYALKGGYDE